MLLVLTRKELAPLWHQFFLWLSKWKELVQNEAQPLIHSWNWLGGKRVIDTALTRVDLNTFNRVCCLMVHCLHFCGWLTSHTEKCSNHEVEQKNAEVFKSQQQTQRVRASLQWCLTITQGKSRVEEAEIQITPLTGASVDQKPLHSALYYSTFLCASKLLP